MIGSNRSSEMVEKIQRKLRKLFALVYYDGDRPVIDRQKSYDPSDNHIDVVGRAMGGLKWEGPGKRNDGWTRWLEGKGVVEVRAHARQIANIVTNPRLPVDIFRFRSVLLIHMADTS